MCKLPSSWPRSARKGRPKWRSEGGGVARNSRCSDITFPRILCATPYAAAVHFVLMQKWHSRPRGVAKTFPCDNSSARVVYFSKTRRTAAPTPTRYQNSTNAAHALSIDGTSIRPSSSRHLSNVSIMSINADRSFTAASPLDGTPSVCSTSRVVVVTLSKSRLSKLCGRQLPSSPSLPRRRTLADPGGPPSDGLLFSSDAAKLRCTARSRQRRKTDLEHEYLAVRGRDDDCAPTAARFVARAAL